VLMNCVKTNNTILKNLYIMGTNASSFFPILLMLREVVCPACNSVHDDELIRTAQRRLAARSVIASTPLETLTTTFVEF